MIDSHMHTRFSGDSEADPLDMIKAARERGLDGVCFTDHLDLDYQEEPHLFDLDIEGYLSYMADLKKRYETSGFKIYTGIELGLKSELAQKHHELLKEYSFDLVIGSVHVVNGRDPYYRSFYDGISAREAYRLYFDQVLSNIRSFDEYDTLGHLDYVARYGLKYFNEPLVLSEYADQLEAILKHLILHGKALEINTGSFRYGMKEPNPSYDILRLYYDLGGRDVTIGADAHSPQTVGDHFEEVLRRTGPYFRFFRKFRLDHPEYQN